MFSTILKSSPKTNPAISPISRKNTISTAFMNSLLWNLGSLKMKTCRRGSIWKIFSFKIQNSTATNSAICQIIRKNHNFDSFMGFLALELRKLKMKNCRRKGLRSTLLNYEKCTSQLTLSLLSILMKKEMRRFLLRIWMKITKHFLNKWKNLHFSPTESTGKFNPTINLNH